MENKLLDNYFASGQDTESFITEMKELTMRTSYQFVDTSLTYLLSYHKTVEELIEGTDDIKRTYYFYKLDRSNLSKFEKYNNGLTNVPFVIRIKKGEKSTSCEFFEEIIKNTGLILVYVDEEGNTHYNGISKYAMKTLCKKADIKGEHIYKKGLFRDLYIADRLLAKYNDEENEKTERLLNDGFKIVVRHNLKKNRKGELVKKGFGVVIGVFSGTYNEDSMMTLVELYNLICKNEILGASKLTYWESNQGYSSVNIEFPEAADVFQEKYNLPVKLIPGIQMVSSDCGLSSLVISGTFRVEGSNYKFIVSEYTRKHTGIFFIPDIMITVEETVIKKLEPYAESLGKLTEKPLSNYELKTERGKQRNRGLIQNVIKNCFEQLSLARILGQKRSTLVKKYMLETLSDDIVYTYYDIADMFFHIDEYIAEVPITTILGKTAEENLAREIYKIANVNFAKYQEEYEKKMMKKEMAKEKVSKKNN